MSGTTNPTLTQSNRPNNNFGDDEPQESCKCISSAIRAENYRMFPHFDRLNGHLNICQWTPRSESVYCNALRTCTRCIRRIKSGYLYKRGSPPEKWKIFTLVYFESRNLNWQIYEVGENRWANIEPRFFAFLHLLPLEPPIVLLVSTYVGYLNPRVQNCTAKLVANRKNS